MSAPWSWVIEPVVTFGFMRWGLVVAGVVGTACGVLSALLVVRQEALLGDAVSHAVLPGVAVGYLAAGTAGILAGALGAALVSGLAITLLQRTVAIKPDAAMGIVYTTAFALGLAIISVAQPRGIDLFHVLFGNILALTPGDVWLATGMGVAVVLCIALMFRWLAAWSFDPTLAAIAGVRVRPLSYLFTLVLSATIVASMKTVGLLLGVAMLIIPGVTAIVVAHRLWTAVVLAGTVGLIAGWTGLYLSYHVGVASGPAIVLTAACIFVVTLVLSARRSRSSGRAAA